MKSEFELKSLDNALQRLLNDGILKNEEQKKKLYDLYKEDKRNYPIIHNEINKLRLDEKLLQEKLKQDTLIAGKDAKTIDTTKKVEYTLSLENVSDFEKEGKKYIKVHYPYPYDEVRIIENNDPHMTGKQRFEELQGTQKIMSTDGTTNATSIFEQSLIRDCTEVKMHDMKEISKSTEFSKLSSEEKEIVYGTLVSVISTLDVNPETKAKLSRENVEIMLDLLNKKISISPSENIVVVSTPNSISDDEVKTLKIESVKDVAGKEVKKYNLSPLNDTGYLYNGQSTENESESMDQKENEEVEISKEDDIDKEMGTAYSLKQNRRKKKNEAAFISLLWFVIFAGVITSIILAGIINMFIK